MENNSTDIGFIGKNDCFGGILRKHLISWKKW